MLLEIGRILQLAAEHQIPVSLCGEMASDPVAVVLLLGLGPRTLSMSKRPRYPCIKRLIRSLSIKTAERSSQSNGHAGTLPISAHRVEAALGGGGIAGPVQWAHHRRWEPCEAAAPPDALPANRVKAHEPRITARSSTSCCCWRWAPGCCCAPIGNSASRIAWMW